MTESLRDLGNTQLFTYTLHINTLSLMAGRKQLESSHVTLSMTHYAQHLNAAHCTLRTETLILSLTLSVYMSNTEINMACV